MQKLKIVNNILVWFARAVLTKYHRLGGLNNRNLFILLKSKIKVPTGFFFLRPLSLLCRLQPSRCPHMVSSLCSHILRVSLCVWLPLLFKKFFIYLFLERGERREIERGRNINVWLPLKRPLLGTWPATQACDLNGNQTSDLPIHRLALSLLSHTRQGWFPLLIRWC